MAAEFEMLATSAATTIVGLMATDAWRQARSLLAGVWRRNLPDQAGRLEQDLDGADRIVAVARQGGADAVEDAVRTDWRRRITDFLAENPDARDDLREALRQMPEPPRQESNRTTFMYSRVQDFGRNYQTAGNMEIHE
ncbi:hypothetical protein BJY16_004613 [Actinoplanes octamycinicus]|uniref:Uncharacterized protein n=1 Tax=Actinoplanes octamycinicus TaxID=135948 RepID=A0A7W7M8R1_9ACTN|nr:hypothetical protein [Actinoplanes octamycinicus]MBB4741154.1 hypothetical protein [Actinoplanes octamycinicus]GIE56061.1 hypothetical protein Aoc01nite_14630 [Actinoplanes octamycinicus]